MAAGFFQNGMALLTQGRTLAHQAFIAAYKYVTVEEPDANGRYYYSKPTGERVEITSEKIRPLAYQVERLEREKIRWLNVANCGGGLCAMPVAVSEWAENRLLALIYCIGVYKGIKHVKKAIDQFFNPKIEAMKQQIAKEMEALSGKKRE